MGFDLFGAIGSIFGLSKVDDSEVVITKAEYASLQEKANNPLGGMMMPLAIGAGALVLVLVLAK